MKINKINYRNLTFDEILNEIDIGDVEALKEIVHFFPKVLKDLEIEIGATAIRNYEDEALEEMYEIFGTIEIAEAIAGKLDEIINSPGEECSVILDAIEKAINKWFEGEIKC